MKRSIMAVTIAIAAAVMGLVLPASATGAGVTCRPTEFTQATYYLKGTLCKPTGNAAATVVLVHGSTYDSRVWNPPGLPESYSVLHQLAEAGYQTLAIDRLGSGASTRPPNEAVTADASADALHAIIRQLRRDAKFRTEFGKLFVVGHSSGSTLAIREAEQYGDVDGLVSTGVLHTPAITTDLFTPLLHPASEDARFETSPLPSGYVTTWPGARRIWYYPGNVTEQAFLTDEMKLKDAMSSEDSGGFVEEVFENPHSNEVRVPALAVVGAWDQDSCTPPTCPQASSEASFWSASPDFKVIVRPRTGHTWMLHQDANETTKMIAEWIDSHDEA